MDSIRNCKNCNTALIGEFCHHCSQNSLVDRITFKETFRDFLDNVFSVNAPLIKTLKLLIVDPGKLYREFIGGHRKKYYKPVSFFIICAVLYIILRSWLNYNPMERTATDNPNVNSSSIFYQASAFMVEHINNIMFIFVFMLGFFFKMFFRKKANLAEFTAISFYLVGVYALLGSIIMFYLRFVNPNFKALPVLLLLFYSIYSLMSFFRSKSFLTLIRIFLAYIFALLFYVIFGYGLSFLIVWLNSI